METHSQKFKVRLGLFIAGGLALFIIAVFIIGKQKNLFNPVIELTTTFSNVSGLQVGNNVRFSGITIGTVDQISIINATTVRVDMLIRKEIQKFIKADSEVGIGSEGLIGDRLLIISQGSPDSPLVKENQQLKSVEPVETDAIIASLQTTSGSVEIVAAQLAEMMLKINSGRGTLGRIIHDSIIAQNLSQTITNFKESSVKLNETMDTASQKTFMIMSSLQVTAANAELISQGLDDIVVKINNGQGTIGKLVQDTVVAEDLSLTIENLKKSSKGLDENMEALKHNFLFRRYYKNKAKEEMKESIKKETP
jgi:phospholipid/cholesterol/gamma-HCH transport system substrate-binding protein